METLIDMRVIISDKKSDCFLKEGIVVADNINILNVVLDNESIPRLFRRNQTKATWTSTYKPPINENIEEDTVEDATTPSLGV